MKAVTEAGRLVIARRLTDLRRAVLTRGRDGARAAALELLPAAQRAEVAAYWDWFDRTEAEL